MTYNFSSELGCAKKLDSEDKLSKFRERFYINPGTIYMDGNSLGLCSKDAENCILKVIEDWKKYDISIWNVYDGRYFLLQDHLAKLTAPILNADPEEITIMSSTTMNIHSAISTFYKPTKERYKIMVDELNFPTDIYAVKSQLALKGINHEDALIVVKSRDGRTISEDDVIAAMSDDVAIILLSAVLYRSSQLMDMERVTAEAHKRGIFIGWDLCHSIGSVPHDLTKVDADFAIWCNYKYLSAGPGAVGGFYINKKHFGMEPGLAGWHGYKKSEQFLMKHDFNHALNAGGWQTGTLPLLAAAPLEGVLNIYKEAGMDNIRKKSLHLTNYLMYLIDEKLAKYGCEVGNPRDDSKRGGHVSLEHPEAYRITQALRELKVIPDFREPNVIRLAPIALYTSFEEVYKVVEIIEDILKTKSYEKISKSRALVV